MSVFLLLRNIFSNYVVFGATGIIGLVLTPILFRHLGPNNYAVLVLALATTAVLEAVHLCLQSGLIRFVSSFAAQQDYSGLRRLISSFFYVLLGVGALESIALVLLSPHLFRMLQVESTAPAVGGLVLGLVGLGLVFQLPCTALRGLLAGCQDFHLANAVELVVILLRAAGTATLILWGFGLPAIAALFPAEALLRLIGMLIAARWAAVPFRPSLAEVNRASLKLIGAFASLTLVHETTSSMFSQLDNFLAAKLLPLSNVATLAVARKFPQALTAMAFQTIGVSYPIVSSVAARQDRGALERFMGLATRNLLVLMLPVATGLFTWASVVLQLWIGPTVQSVGPIVQVMVVLAIFSGLEQIPLTLLYGIGRVAFCAKVSIAALLAGAVFGAWACSAGGLMGLVVVYTFVQVGSAAVLFGESMRCAGLRLGNLWKRALFPVVAAELPTVAWFAFSYQFLSHTLTGLFASVLIGALLFMGIFVGRSGAGRQDLSWSNRLRRLLVVLD